MSNACLRKRSARFIQKELPSSKVREIVATEDAFDEHLWQQMAEQGWMSVTVPSEFGGMADSWLTVAVLFEELGWGMAPGPFLATVGLAAPLLAARRERGTEVALAVSDRGGEPVGQPSPIWNRKAATSSIRSARRPARPATIIHSAAPRCLCLTPLWRMW